MSPIEENEQNSPNEVFEDPSDNDFNELDSLYKNVLSKSNEGDLVWQQTREMVKDIDNRIHYWEDRRSQFLTYALGVLSLSFAGALTLIPKFISDLVNSVKNQTFLLSVNSVIFIPIFLFFITLIIGSILLILLWNRQNNPDYPFTKGTKIWRWQYQGAEKTKSTIKIKYNQKEFIEEVNKFSDNEEYYKKRLLNSSKAELFNQDLSQLFLLLINEKYKIKFVSSLRNMMFRIILISLSILIFSLIILAVIKFIIYY